MIDYTPLKEMGQGGLDGYFGFQEAIHTYGIIDTELLLSLSCVSLDEHLRMREEEDYFARIETHPEDYTKEDIYKRLGRFGTIAIGDQHKGIGGKRGL